MVNTTISTRSRLLQRLREAEGPISGTRLAEELGLSRVAVWKHLEALREAGYALEADHAGYRLAAEGDFLHPWEFPGRESRIRRYERTDSTMDRAVEEAIARPGSRAVILAEAQSAGRGRRGRSWESPPGGLFATILLEPAIEPPGVLRVGLLGALHLAACLRDLVGEPFGVEWPNDVVLQGKKVGGVLVEYLAAGEKVRILSLGIGANVANPAPGSQALSLLELSGRRPSRRLLLAALLDRLDRLDIPGAELAPLWREFGQGEGRPLAARTDGSSLGRAIDIDEAGRILALLPNGSSRAYGPGEAYLSDKERP